VSATDELSPWWGRRPDRLRWELANFADAGLPARLEGDRIHTQIALSNGRGISAIVTFPFEYPLAHPDVHVEPGLLGPPHEVRGTLCLLDNPGGQWHPQRSAAELVANNARGLLEAALIGGPEVLAEREEQIPLLANRLYQITQSLVVLVPDPFWSEPPAGVNDGWFVLAGEGERRLLQQVIPLGQAPAQLKSSVQCENGLELGRWLALDQAPAGHQTPQSLLGIGLSVIPDLLQPLAGETPILPRWVGITYPEQGPGRGQWRRGWTFIQLQQRAGQPPAASRIAHTQALTASERRLRLPELTGIERAKIVLIGVGSLGSKVAIELAKAGTGRLVLWDHDRYDVNNAVRHELPVSAAGSYKAAAMADACQRANPFCEAVPDCEPFGIAQVTAEKFLERLQEAHLVIETTGSREVTRIVERYCRLASIPLLTASLTRGSRGGDMLLLAPELCLDCFLLAQQQQLIPSPSEGEQPLVLPIGCADPAFSGTGFDASELASAVARMAMRTTALTQYPPLDHNWAVVNFVDQPRWTQGTIEPNPTCGHR
jgi:molybdopterin/thiamine biosynthesis adenylyltransferase